MILLEHKSDHVPSLLKTFQWLLISPRINANFLSPAHKTLHDGSPGHTGLGSNHASLFPSFGAAVSPTGVHPLRYFCVALFALNILP